MDVWAEDELRDLVAVDFPMLKIDNHKSCGGTTRILQNRMLNVNWTT